ncbi:MAG: SDR family oxidoreductase [Cumulibacter sp.]
MYAASKAAVIGLVHCLAEEFGERGITVNAIAPGLVMTPLSAAIAGSEQNTIATRAIKRASDTDDYIEPVRFFCPMALGSSPDRH